jgi:hypothetical protein
MRAQRIISTLIVCWPWSFMAAQQPSATGFPGMVPAPEIGPYVATAAPAAPGSFDEVVDRTIEREHQLVSQLSALRPMVETYVQSMKADTEGSAKPIQDQYFLRRLDLASVPGAIAFVAEREPVGKREAKLISLFAQPLQPAGISRMLVLDTALYKKDYNFTFVRREFLGEVRCVVIDAQPRTDAAPGKIHRPHLG